MSTRYNNGSHYENHQRAAELHDIGGHAHRSAEQQHGKQDHLTGQERSRQEHEHSAQAFDQPHQVRHHTDYVDHDAISTLAHRLWLKRGSPAGSPEIDWHEAVNQLILKK